MGDRPIRQSVYEAVADGYTSPLAISEATNLPIMVVKTELDHLRGEGRVEIGNKGYEIADGGANG